jgi:hypothetical protein
MCFKVSLPTRGCWETDRRVWAREWKKLHGQEGPRCAAFLAIASQREVLRVLSESEPLLMTLSLLSLSLSLTVRRDGPVRASPPPLPSSTR